MCFGFPAPSPPAPPPTRHARGCAGDKVRACPELGARRISNYRVAITLDYRISRDMTLVHRDVRTSKERRVNVGLWLVA